MKCHCYFFITFIHLFYAILFKILFFVFKKRLEIVKI